MYCQSLLVLLAYITLSTNGQFRAIEYRRACTVHVSSNPVHLNRSSSSCGTGTRPWIVEAPSGQQLNITLLEFNASTQHVRPTHSCQNRGAIMDKTALRNITICVGGGGQRERQLFTSTGHSVLIIFSQYEQSNNSENEQQFTLKFQAVGCADIIPPEDAYSKRNGNELKISCYTRRETWHLYCRDGKWIGEIGNCTERTAIVPPLKEEASGDMTKEQTFRFECNATSDPNLPPTVRWYKLHGDDNKVPVHEEPPDIRIVDGALIIHIAAYDIEKWMKYRGVYKCIADNGYSQAEKTVTLFLSTAPSDMFSNTSGACVSSAIYWSIVGIVVTLCLNHPEVQP